jgi:hypothetical protein
MIRIILLGFASMGALGTLYYFLKNKVETQHQLKNLVSCSDIELVTLIKRKKIYLADLPLDRQQAVMKIMEEINGDIL